MMNDEKLLAVCQRMQRTEGKQDLLSLHSNGELIEIIEGLIDTIDALEEKHNKLIAELESLKPDSDCERMWDIPMFRGDDLKALIDKYKGGE